METMVKKWGNSLGIRIPNQIARELSIKDGSFVTISDREREIVIKPIPKNKLSEMLNQINDENIHEEIKTTGPVGREIW